VSDDDRATAHSYIRCDVDHQGTFERRTVRFLTIQGESETIFMPWPFDHCGATSYLKEVF
jgi:hypothetical protein